MWKTQEDGTQEHNKWTYSFNLQHISDINFIK